MSLINLRSQRAERMARGEEEDPASTNRLSMAHAALLNMRGAQVQAQLQAQAQTTRQTQADTRTLLSPRDGFVDDFGRISSTGHLPLHPHTYSPAQARAHASNLLSPNAGMNVNADAGQQQQYQYQFAQAQEYARLLESTVRGMGISLSDLDLDVNADPARVRRSPAPGLRMPLSVSTAQQMQSRGGDQFSGAFSQQQQSQMQMQMQQMRQLQEERPRQGRQGRAAAQPHLLMPSADIQSDFAQYASTRSFAPPSQQQYQQQHRPQHQHQQSKRIFDLTSTASNATLDGQHHSHRPEHERKQLHGHHSNAPLYSSRGTIAESEAHQYASAKYAHGADSTPLVSPALTYTSRTPSTLSPATPFFGSFTPAAGGGEGDRDRRKVEYQQ